MNTLPKSPTRTLRRYRLLALQAAALLCIGPHRAACQKSATDIPAQTVQTATAYDIAVIRENPSDEHARNHIYSSPDSLTFRAVNAPLTWLLRYAFGLPETQILNIPAALAHRRFDVEAKVDPVLDANTHTLTAEQRSARKQAMLQALFAERFALKFHPETREEPIYLLTVGKGGSRLQPGKGDHVTNERRGDYQANGITTGVLAEVLARQTGRIVFDRTGSEGIYDLTLTWSPDDAPASDTSAPSIFVAVQEQLGLKLEPAKGPVPVIVVDHIEAPSAN